MERPIYKRCPNCGIIPMSENLVLDNCPLCGAPFPSNGHHKKLIIGICAAIIMVVGCLLLIISYTNSYDYKAACKAGDYDAAMECLENLKEEAEEADEPDNFDAAMKRVEKMHDKYLDALSGACHNYYRISALEGPRQVYWSSLGNAYKKEIMYLVTSDNAEAADRIVFLLNEIPIDGTKKVGLIDYYEACMDREDGQELRAYISYVEHFNMLCDIALDLAINRQNKDMAKKIVRCYKPDVIVTKGDDPALKVEGVSVDGNHGYVQLKNNSKESASKRLKEAIDAGDFD